MKSFAFAPTLVLTIAFVSEAFVPQTQVFQPSISSYRHDAMRQRHGPLFVAGVALEEEQQKQQKEDLKRRLPSINHRESLTKLELEFRQLLQDMLFLPEEMESVTNPRLRIIFEGVAASYYEPAVYRAFEVLYEDYRPLRIAGRFIHQRLLNVMKESSQYRQSQIDAVATTLATNNQDIVNNTDRMAILSTAWARFVDIAADKTMPLDKVERLVMRARQLDMIDNDNDDNSDTNALMTIVNPKQHEQLSFEDLFVGLNEIVAMPDDPSTPSAEGQILKLLEIGAEDSKICLHSDLDRKRQKFNKKYDDMLVKFGEWKEFIPSGEGRRLDILKGCFVGSENPQVVAALRVIYTDYTALRLSGDWIFGVVSAIMNATLKRRQKQQQQLRP